MSKAQNSGGGGEVFLCGRKYFTIGKQQAQDVSGSGEPDGSYSEYCMQPSAPGKLGLVLLSHLYFSQYLPEVQGMYHPVIRSRLVQPGPCSSLETGCPLMLCPSDSHSPGE